MRRSWWRRVRLLGGLAVLAVLVWRTGARPFLHGLRIVDGRTLLLACVLTVPITVCGAWRWRLVARGLGLGLPLPAAVAACYRSQFLNTALPAGVVGDLHRGVRHGRDAGDTGRGLRAVGWERFAGQLVQGAAALLVLLLLPSPLRSSGPVAVTVVVGLVTLVVVGLVALARVRTDRRTRWAAALRGARSDLRSGLLSARAWPGIVLASLAAVAGHVTTFVVAARAAGVTAPLLELVPLALLVLLAMAIPLNVAGWGPREGVAAWAFAAAGIGAGAGIATAVVYGVMVLVAALPGAVVLLVGRGRVVARA